MNFNLPFTEGMFFDGNFFEGRSWENGSEESFKFVTGSTVLIELKVFTEFEISFSQILFDGRLEEK